MSHSNAPHLALYYFERCPYCQLVLNKINELDLKLDYKDITQDKSSLDKLIKDTGRRTVPCLYIDNKPMHESADIVKWLEANKHRLTRN